MEHHTQRLAEFVAETPYSALPEASVHEAKRAILDGLGVGVGGADHPSVRLLLAYARSLGGRPQAQVWGHADRLPAQLAALVNGQSEHVLDFDDTYLPAETVLHGTVPLLPALLAVAEHRGRDGKAILRGFVLGFEAEARLARALGRSHYEGGWHVTATVGPVGAAVGVATMIGLSAEQTRHAIGIAVTQSSGVDAQFGSSTKAYQCAKGAEAGVRAALLAELGFDSVIEPLTHPEGFATIITSDRAYHRLTDDLGARYLLLDNGYKPYASGVVTHPVIDAMIALRAEGIHPDDIVAVDAMVTPFVLKVTGQAEPTTGLQGKFSAYHCAAVSFIDGAAGKQQFTDDRVNASEVVALRRKVRLAPTDGLRKDEAEVVLTLRDGSQRRAHIPRASGTQDNPMTDDQLTAKFLALCEPVIGDRARALADAIWSLESAPSMDAIASLVRM